MHFASLHGHDRTHEAQKITLLIYVDSSRIYGYACTHIYAHRIAHTHPNERNKRISDRTKRASELSELNESLCKSSYLKRIKQSHINHSEPNKPPHRMKQANHAEREMANLMADKRIAQQQTKASDLQT